MYIHIYTHTLFTFFNSPEDLEAFGELASDSLVKALNTLEWNEQQINNFEEKVYQSGLQSAYCYSDDDFVSVIKKVFYCMNCSNERRVESY